MDDDFDGCLDLVGDTQEPPPEAPVFDPKELESLGDEEGWENCSKIGEPDHVYLDWDMLEAHEWEQKIMQVAPKSDPKIVKDLVARSTAEFLQILVSIRGRGLFARDTMLQYGYIDSDMLRDSRYNCHTKEISDLEATGITLERVPQKGGRKKYYLAPEKFKKKRESRNNLLPEERKRLWEIHNHCCVFCPPDLVTPKFLRQDDHKVPYHMVGNDHFKLYGLDAMQPVCSSHNTQKNEHCRKCPNHHQNGDPNVCLRCYWGNPNDYDHIEMKPRRMLTVLATTEEDCQLIKEISPKEVLELLRKAFNSC